jgi:hypothetical protein
MELTEMVKNQKVSEELQDEAKTTAKYQEILRTYE